MKRSREQQLEYKSRLALKNLLPPAWIVRDVQPDVVGIDLEIEIVEGEEVTNKVLWVQVKATEKKETSGGAPSLRMETKHLKHYENCRIPVIIVYGIKKNEGDFDFYSLFAQKHIREELSASIPNWRNQDTATVRFESKLESARELDSIATDGYLYVAAQQLNINPGGAYYWLDGIPQSDDNELKGRTLKALLFMRDENYPAAIVEYENILKNCTVAPTERMAILLNIGIAKYSLGKIDEALDNYYTVIKITGKVSEKDALEGKSAALGNIGLIYRAKGDRDNALKYLRDALKIHQEIGYRQGEANQLGNIGLIYRAKGDRDNALKYLRDALEILDKFNLVYGRDTILNAIKSIEK